MLHNKALRQNSLQTHAKKCLPVLQHGQLQRYKPLQEHTDLSIQRYRTLQRYKPLHEHTDLSIQRYRTLQRYKPLHQHRPQGRI